MPDKIVNHFVLADGSVARYDFDGLVNAPSAYQLLEMVTFKQSIGVEFINKNTGRTAINGNSSASSIVDTTNYIQIPDGVDAIICKCPTYVSTTAFGFVFSSTNTAGGFTKGYTFNVTGAYGTEWRVFFVPNGSGYFSTSWFHDTTTYGEWEGYYCYGLAEKLNGADVVDFPKLDADIYGSQEEVEYTYHDKIVVNGSGVLYRIYVGGGTYGSISVQLEPNAEYIINATNNELMRIGFTRTEATPSVNGDTNYKTLEWLNVTDKNHYRFKNTNGYPYMFVFGRTPNFPNPTFEVFKAVGGLVSAEKQEIETGVVDLIDRDAKYFYNDLKNSYIKTIDGFRLFVASSFGAGMVNFSLSDISKNLAHQNTTEAINGQPAIATVGYCEVVDVLIDFTFGDTSFTECSIGIRKPNASTTMQQVCRIVPSDLTDGHITINKQLHFETGTELGVLFIYYSNPTTNVYDVTGSLSVVKRKQTIDNITINDIPYYLDNASEPFDLSRGYVKTIGKLHKNGKYIVDANNVPVELRGVGTHALLQYNNLHGRKALDSLRHIGVNLIRITVYLEDYIFINSDNEIAYGYLSKPNETKAEIEKIIKNCIDLGLYVLLDWHVFSNQTGIVGEPYTGTEVLHQTEAVDFFEYFTTKYADCPNMLWEIANEPYNLTPAQITDFVEVIREIIVDNVTDPVMVVGAGYTEPNTWYNRCKTLYQTMETASITDVFVSPHPYNQDIVSDLTTLFNENVPVFMSEWGSSGSSGDGAGNDTNALNNMNFVHQNCVPSSFWKFTDQVMTTSALNNQGIINSEKWLDGFNWGDLSHNGVLHLSRYYDFIHNEWINRTAIS